MQYSFLSLVELSFLQQSFRLADEFILAGKPPGCARRSTARSELR
jgi:hypothetical protein